MGECGTFQVTSVTPKQAEERGMGGLEHPTCELCGADLAGTGITSLDGTRVIRWSVMNCGCEGAVKIREEHHAKVVEEEKRKAVAGIRERKEIRLRYLAAAGIPDKFTTAKVEGEAPTRYVRAFGPDMHRGLYLIGGVGAGKTYAAAAVAVAIADKGFRVAFSTTLGLLNEVKSTFGDGDSDESEVMDHYSKADLLVLDDLGKEPPKEWALSVLWALVNNRYESTRPTIVTTQYDDAALLKRLAAHGDKETAEAIVSRLREMCYRVEMIGGDRR